MDVLKGQQEAEGPLEFRQLKTAIKNSASGLVTSQVAALTTGMGM